MTFDRLARWYAPLERVTFGRTLERRRACFLDDPSLSRARRVVVLGDGDGRFTASLLLRYPSVEVTVVDVSAGMLSLLEARVRRSTPHAALHLCCLDVRDWAPGAERYDVVASHFFFDCFSSADVERIVQRIALAIDAGGRWLVSEFAVPQSRAMSIVARVLIRLLYVGFRLMTGLRVTRLPDHAMGLRAAGFALSTLETSLGGVLRSELGCAWSRRPLVCRLLVGTATTRHRAAHGSATTKIPL